MNRELNKLFKTVFDEKPSIPVVAGEEYHFYGFQDELRDTMTLWLLRILHRVGGLERVLDEKGDIRCRRDIIRWLGLDHWLATESGPGLAEAKCQIAALWQQAEANVGVAVASPTSCLIRNLNVLTDSLSLSRAEVRLVLFTLINQACPILSSVLSAAAPYRSLWMRSYYLSIILGVDKDELDQALSENGRLLDGGLIVAQENLFTENWELECVDGLFEALSSATFTLHHAFAQSFKPVAPTRLSAGCFDYLKRDCGEMTRYLEHAMTYRRRGTNILVYGKPGTGKTELARWVSGQMQANLYEVSSGHRHVSLNGVKRLKSYALSQAILSGNERNLLLFDEVEDVFRPAELFSENKISKAWVNRLLEENCVPAIWITNSIDDIDKAHLRRFSMIVAMPDLPDSARLAIIKGYFGETGLSERMAAKLAGHEALVPATLKRVARLASVAWDENQTEGVDAYVERQVNQWLTLSGAERLPKSMMSYSALNDGLYDPGHINADDDLALLRGYIWQGSEMRLCLYGPPGTGKTAWAKWVAQQCGRPLVSRKASQLLGKYVGDTEKQLAAAFAEASQVEGVLLIDEFDTFAADRAGARNQWETSQVNELLAQLDEYQGVFIATTNHLSRLDGAILRRFDKKVKFDFLTAPAREAMFKKLLLAAGRKRTTLTPANLGCLQSLDFLTPSDFFTVIREMRFVKKRQTAESLLDRLQKQQSFKPEARQRRIGFVA